MFHGRTMARPLRAVFIDLSGTLHVEDAPVPGASVALARLREAGAVVRFVTNTTKESGRSLYERLRRMGFELHANEMFTSLSAARDVVKVTGVRPLLLLEQSALEDFREVDTSRPNAVLVGLAPDKFNSETLNEALRLLMEGASLIAVHKARYYRRADGLALGPGPFVEALTFASGVEPQLVGKPAAAFFQRVLANVGCEAHEAVMIGDDVCGDVQGAQDVGIMGFLVQTGKYRTGDETTVDKPPAGTFPDFPATVEFLLKNFNFGSS
uniref:haloacid dehalogenase-like hydrolase domain-containing protein 2 n=1 Tax=Myxine glutinosa TaxID=7769 RepID=UPI00358FDACA